jgi:DNA-binding transcriptional regulator YiaG
MRACPSVRPKTVQVWEKGLRVLSDADLKLLSLARKYPDVLLKA